MCVIKKEKGRGAEKGEETKEAELCRAPYASEMVALPIPVVVCREELSKLRELRLCCTRPFHGVVCRSETNKFNTGNAWGIKSFDLAEGLRCSMLVVFFVQYQSSAQLCATPALQQLELEGQSEGVSRHTGGKYLSIT